MQNNLKELAKLVRYYSLVSTTEAGSGHPSSSLSAADLMTGLMFGGFFKADLENPQNPNNDRLIFSKGHASPLFYSLYAVAGQRDNQNLFKDLGSTSPVPSGHPPHAWGGREQMWRAMEPEEILTLRKFGSRLEGHPTLEFKYTEVPTGSLGQGLSVGVGMALNGKLDKLSYNTFVLLGDSEMAEGSVWEAMAVASHYRLNNLVAILDVNRLGQRGETMLGHHTEIYQKRAEAFGWETVVIDGHDFEEIETAFEKALANAGVDSNNISSTSPVSSPGQERRKQAPTMIIARTLKGKGVSFIEDKDGGHGKALSREELDKALAELGEVDKSIIGEIAKPEKMQNEELRMQNGNPKFTEYPKDKKVATRKAFGNALVNLAEAFPNMVVLDAEVSNSTFTEFFKKKYPDRFFEMFIAEQNMVGVATGLDKRGKLVFASTFAAFFARAFDQIRMSQYANSNIKFVQSHAGVSIGEDGASQMALEDLAMFRTLLGISVLYPCDAVSAEKITYEAAKHQGSVYIRNTRMETPIIYSVDEEFPIGGSKVLKLSATDVATVIGAGVTLHEALAAYEELKKEGINIRVIDLYSIKPLDVETLKKAAEETRHIITVEDHFAEGGLGEAVLSAISNKQTAVSCKIINLAVTKMPRSGKPDELLAYEEINRDAIIKAVKQLTLPNTN